MSYTAAPAATTPTPSTRPGVPLDPQRQPGRGHLAADRAGSDHRQRDAEPLQPARSRRRRYNFGNVTVGTAVQKSVTVTNIGRRAVRHHRHRARLGHRSGVLARRLRRRRRFTLTSGAERRPSRSPATSPVARQRRSCSRGADVPVHRPEPARPSGAADRLPARHRALLQRLAQVAQRQHRPGAEPRRHLRQPGTVLWQFRVGVPQSRRRALRARSTRTPPT